MMMPPLPIQLKRAEVRIAGSVVSVSAHGVTIRTQLQPSMAEAMWEQLGARPDQVSVTVRGVAAGAELIRLGERRFGMRVWIGPLSVRVPVMTRYWEVMRSQELAAREELVHVA
jgi:uncharacterized membrane protein